MEAQNKKISTGYNDEEFNEEQSNVIKRLNRNEQEIVFGYNADDKECWCYCSIPSLWRKLEMKKWVVTDITYYKDGEVLSKKYKARKEALSFRKNEVVKRNMTEEQKEKQREVMKIAREKRNGK